jgi:D-arabinose 1-dehydrogenase-like Zn-dependent alcohol dehydrogenase
MRTMRAAVMSGFGGPEVLEMRELALPEPGPGEVRVRVDAVIVNNTRDVLTRDGRALFSRFVTPPHILGGEHAGTIDAVGENVDPAMLTTRVAVAAVVRCGRCEWCARDEGQVCAAQELIGVHRPGAYAEFAIVPVDNTLPMPDELSSVDGVVLATTGPVGLAQVNAAAVGDGDVLVVPGVSGALGSMVAAIASRRGVRVIGLARDLWRAQTMPLSADVILDAGAADLADQLREACGDSGAHAIIDNVCVSPIWDACLSVLRPQGRVVMSGAMGDKPVTIDPRRIYFSNHSILGVRTSNRGTIEAFWTAVRGGFRLESGLVDTFPLASAAEVHRLVEAGEKHGHYVLLPNVSA